VQQLLEWAYGFRYPKYPEQRFTRRSPSAGGLYPTEIFISVKTIKDCLVLYYHFVTHEFYRVPVVESRWIMHELGLADGIDAIILTSVFWRSVQRYGVRGYRYCLLDAANVASNLIFMAHSLDPNLEITLHSPSARLEKSLDLCDSEGAILVIGLKQKRTVPYTYIPSTVSPFPSAHKKAIEDIPSLSPALNRVLSFHRKTLLPSKALKSKCPRLAKTSAEEACMLADKRYSARDFTGQYLEASQYERMVEAAIHFPQIITRGIPTIEVQSLNKITNGLVEACQKQSILTHSAFALVFVTNKRDLAVAGYVGYRSIVLNVGFICAALYREAARCSIGTTTIGGFSDCEVSNFLGNTAIQPIAIQSFGVSVCHGDKADATSKYI